VTTPALLWLSDHVGEWTGTNKFRFRPTDEYEESPSHAGVGLRAHGHVAIISHTWVYEGEEHEGLLVIGAGAEQDAFQSTWTESWHQKPQWLSSTGRLIGPKTLQLEGSYAPNAGWNIRIEAEDSSKLNIVMDHVFEPHGTYPVVIAEYRRT